MYGKIWKIASLYSKLPMVLLKSYTVARLFPTKMAKYVVLELRATYCCLRNGLGLQIAKFVFYIYLILILFLWLFMSY